MAHPFDRFREIVLGDTEFISRPGELYEPVCVGVKELRSGCSKALWYDELTAEPPHAHGKDILFVGFTGAEPEFYHSIGWRFDCAFLDLRVEGIHQTSLALPRSDPKRQKLPRSLISFLRFHDIPDGDAALKETMRQRIIQGRPFNRKERRLILKYCLGDVLLLEKLLEALLPRIPNFKQALIRGEYVKFTAEMFRRGSAGRSLVGTAVAPARHPASSPIARSFRHQSDSWALHRADVKASANARVRRTPQVG